MDLDVATSEARADARRQRAVELEREHPCAGVGERLRKNARSRADVHNQVAGLHARFANELRCEPATPEEVLPGRRP